MRRCNQDLLLQLIESAYAASEDARLWNSFLRSLAESLAARGAVLLHHDLAASGSVTVNVGADPEGIRLYNEHFHRLDPWAEGMRAFAPAVPATSDMLIAHDKLQRTEYFNDFAVKYDASRLMCVILRRSERSTSLLSILRGEGDAPFESEELRLLSAITPHVRRALQIHQRIHTAERERVVTVEVLDALTCAVFFVDADAEVVLTNRRGDRLLAARDGLSIEHGRLCASSWTDTKNLRNACAAVSTLRSPDACQTGSAFWLDGRPSGKRALQVLITPVTSDAPLGVIDDRVHALVFVTDPADDEGPRESLLRQLYGLTPAECHVAAMLAIGRSLEEIAVERGSALETVRRQNKQILAKTGARHRGELVRRLSTILSPRGDHTL